MDLALVKDVSLLLNAVGAGNCFLLSYVYLRKKERKVQSRGYILSVLFFILGAIILNTIFNFTGYNKLFFGFESLTNALGYAIAPLLFLYVKSYRQTSRQINIWSGHLALFYAILMLSLMAVGFPKSTMGTLGKVLLESEFMKVLWNVHFLGYVLVMFPELRKMLKDQWRTPQIIVFGITSIWFFNLLFYLHAIWIKPLPTLVYLNITLLFSGMTILLFYQKFVVSVDRSRSKAVKMKYKNWLAKTEENDSIVIAIRENKYYKDPNLDIRTLSEQLQLPYHELSARINQEYHQNFNEFINSFRIQEVVNALQNQQHQSFTIMGLAQRAGFKSASVFYAAFKKEKGTTPTRYLEQIAKIS